MRNKPNGPRQLTVIVTGDYQSGKTTLGHLLANTLEKEGFKTEPFRDPEASVQRSESDQIFAEAAWQGAVMRGEVQIKIVEVHPNSFREGSAELAAYRNDLLVKQIDKFLRQAGVISKTAAPMSGPEALYQLEIYGEHLAQHELQEGWFLPKDKLNSLQHASVDLITQRARGAHMTDIDMRINGQNEHHQADWLKHLQPGHACVEKKTQVTASGPELAKAMSDAAGKSDV